MDIQEILLDSVIDSAKMLPFLFLAYLVIELLERKQSHTIEKMLASGGRFGFVPGALLGIVPQCGFSAMAANFYASRVISLGTLLAVFVATSDEALPIMLAQPESYPMMVKLIITKLLLALLVGLLVDVVLRRLLPASLRGGYGSSDKGIDCHDHHEEEGLLLTTAKHTANIFLTILLFTFAFGLLVGALGEENISSFLSGLGLLQPVVAALVGLIPNCASSVLLTQLYLSGAISFGSVVAGLSTNAGIGLTILFRTNRNLRQNFFILGLLFAVGVLAGIFLQATGI